VTLVEKVLAVLSAAPSVTTLVPAARIKPPGDWQDLALPYIVHFPVGVSPTQLLASRAALTEWPFYQISIFAASYSAADAIAVAIRDLLGNANSDGVQFMWTGQRALPFEEDVRIQQIAMDFQIWEAL
jgi:hypothetical protein